MKRFLKFIKFTKPTSRAITQALAGRLEGAGIQ